MSGRFCSRENLIHGLPNLGLMQGPKGGRAHTTEAIGENGPGALADHIRKFRDLFFRDLTGNDGQVMGCKLQSGGLSFQVVKRGLIGPLAIRAQANNRFDARDLNIFDIINFNLGSNIEIDERAFS